MRVVRTSICSVFFPRRRVYKSAGARGWTPFKYDEFDKVTMFPGWENEHILEWVSYRFVSHFGISSHFFDSCSFGEYGMGVVRWASLSMTGLAGH